MDEKELDQWTELMLFQIQSGTCFQSALNAADEFIKARRIRAGLVPLVSPEGPQPIAVTPDGVILDPQPA